MNTSHRRFLKKITYLFTGIAAIIGSSYASFMATSMAMGITILALAFAIKPISAFLPSIVYAFFFVFIFAFSIFVYSDLLARIVRLAKRVIFKALGIDKSILMQLRRIDPFNAVWLWGYLLPVLILSIIAIPKFP